MDPSASSALLGLAFWPEYADLAALQTRWSSLCCSLPDIAEPRADLEAVVDLLGTLRPKTARDGEVQPVLQQLAFAPWQSSVPKCWGQTLVQSHLPKPGWFLLLELGSANEGELCAEVAAALTQAVYGLVLTEAVSDPVPDAVETRAPRQREQTPGVFVH